MEETYQREVGSAARILESHGEYHLPDYAGDIKKMLCSSARIVPTGKFFGGEEVQFAGSVHYDFWYLDSENTLTHEGFSTDYEFSCPRGNATDGGITVTVAQFSLRPSGPRRVSAKASLEGAISLREGAVYTCEAEEGVRLHKRCTEIEMGHRIFSSPREREFAERIPLPAALAEQEAEILFSEANLQIESAEAHDGEILLRGSIVFSAIVSVRALAPMRLRERYPFEERIPCEECEADMAVAVAKGFVTSLTATVQVVRERAIAFDAICEFDCVAEKNKTLSVVRDAFAEHAETSLETEKLQYEVFGGARVLRKNIDLRMPPEREQIGADGVFYASAVLKNATCTPRERELDFSAEAEITALVYTLAEGGAITYGARKASAPISFSVPKLECDLADADCVLEASAYVFDCFAEDGDLLASIDLQLAQKCHTQRELDCVHRVHSAPRTEEGFVPSCTLCFPTEADSLWSLAKRYAVSPADLARQNHISDDEEGFDLKLPSPMLIQCRNK